MPFCTWLLISLFGVIPSFQIPMSLLSSSESLLAGERLKPLPLGKFLQTGFIHTREAYFNLHLFAFARREC